MVAALGVRCEFETVICGEVLPKLAIVVEGKVFLILLLGIGRSSWVSEE
jgi:hypothetical protein